MRSRLHRTDLVGDDEAAFRAKPDGKGARYSDWGESAVAGWHRI